MKWSQSCLEHGIIGNSRFYYAWQTDASQLCATRSGSFLITKLLVFISKKHWCLNWIYKNKHYAWII